MIFWDLQEFINYWKFSFKLGLNGRVARLCCRFSSASGHYEEGYFKANVCEPTIGLRVKNQIISISFQKQLQFDLKVCWVGKAQQSVKECFMGKNFCWKD